MSSTLKDIVSVVAILAVIWLSMNSTLAFASEFYAALLIVVSSLALYRFSAKEEIAQENEKTK